MATAVAATPELSTLARAITAADLVDTLDGPGPFTMFAPSDAAFAQLAPEALDAVLADPAFLTEILDLHIVQGARLSSQDLASAATVDTSGGELTIAASGGGLALNGGAATVICPDIPTANATVHVIDAVLLPTVDETEAVTGSMLYSVDLETGAATWVGPIGDELGVLGLAIAPGGGTSTVYGLTDQPELVTFDAADPTTTATTPITGVAEGTTLLAIDVRPDDGELVALADSGQLYSIDRETGEATPIGDGIGAPLADPGFGFDVDPTTDRIRVLVATGEDLVVDPQTGTMATDAAGTTLAYAADDPNAATVPRVVAAAFSDPRRGARSTQLFVVDTATGSLALLDPLTGGALRTIGSLGVDVTDGASLDIATTGEALLASPG